MPSSPIQLLLADDDADDCLIFKEALDKLLLLVHLTIVHDGEQLMKLLDKLKKLPAALFLDINMPRKNGIECLHEMKKIENLKALPIIMLSTSYDPEMILEIYNKGAHYYIQKPSDFSSLMNVMKDALQKITTSFCEQPDLKNFIIK